MVLSVATGASPQNSATEGSASASPTPLSQMCSLSPAASCVSKVPMVFRSALAAGEPTKSCLARSAFDQMKRDFLHEPLRLAVSEQDLGGDAPHGPVRQGHGGERRI